MFVIVSQPGRLESAAPVYNLEVLFNIIVTVKAIRGYLVKAQYQAGTASRQFKNTPANIKPKIML